MLTAVVTRRIKILDGLRNFEIWMMAGIQNGKDMKVEIQIHAPGVKASPLQKRKDRPVPARVASRPPSTFFQHSRTPATRHAADHQSWPHWCTAAESSDASTCMG